MEFWNPLKATQIVLGSMPSNQSPGLLVPHVSGYELQLKAVEGSGGGPGQLKAWSDVLLYVCIFHCFTKHIAIREVVKKSGYFTVWLTVSIYPLPTLGKNREFWLLWTSLIFQVISWELDVNLLKHITMKILLQIKRYFQFVLWVI